MSEYIDDKFIKGQGHNWKTTCNNAYYEYFQCENCGIEFYKSKYNNYKGINRWTANYYNKTCSEILLEQIIK